MFLLDTNVCIHLLNNADSRIRLEFQKRSPSEIALCSVVKAELLYGAYRSQRVDANLQHLKTFFQPLPSLPFDDRCIEHYALIRADLSSQGRPIGPNDLMIAAIARSNDATLVTGHTGEFGRVSGLATVDWRGEA